MTDNAKKLLQQLSQNKSLSEKFSRLNKDELLAAARELGYDLTEADLSAPESTLSDTELDAVVGGMECSCPVFGIGYSEDDSDDPNCACYQGGAGYVFNH